MNGVCGSLSVFNSGKYLLTSNINYLWLAPLPLRLTADLCSDIAS